MPRARLLALPCLLLIAVLLAACGGAPGAGGHADPAKAVPAGAAIYVEGVLRPEGSQRADVLDAAGKVLRTQDPAAKLHRLIDQGLAQSSDPGLSYEKDIAPWLGQRAGVWVSGVDRAKPGYVVIVATKDTDKAQAALDKGAKDQETTQRSYHGVDYRVDKDGVAAGIVGEFLAVGTEPEFKRTIDVKHRASLAGDKRYTNTIDGLDGSRIGHFYVDLKPFFEQALKSDPNAAGQLEQIRAVFPIDKLEPLGGALLANGDRIAFDTVMRGAGVRSLGAFSPLLGTGTTPLIGELPGDAWGAYGAPNVGSGLRSLFTRVAGALGGAAATQQLQQRYGIDVERDVFGWIGDVALFVRGSDKATLDGGLVIKATDPANMRNAFGKLVGLLQAQGGKKVTPVKVRGAAAAFSAGPAQGLGKPVILARSDDRVVIGIGGAAAADGLAPAQRLGDTELYREAKGLLGGFDPTLLFSMPDLVKAIEAAGTNDPGFAKAKPYLDAFSVVASGGSLQGDELKSRAVAGLR
jgi:hypothetical protein